MEYLDIYDINGNLQNKIIARGDKNFQDGEYIKLAVIWLKCKDKYLVQKCSPQKGGEYAITGGHVPTGFTSEEQAVVELDEELGIKLSIDDITFLGTVIKGNHAMFDIFLYEDDNIDNATITLQEDEVESVNWFTKSEIEKLISNGVFRESSTLHYEKFIKYL